MNTRPTPTPRERTPLTADEVRAIGHQLAYFAKLYEGAAEEMDKSKIEVIEVKGAANMALSLERLNGAVQSLQSSLARARTAPLRALSHIDKLIARNEAAQAKQDKKKTTKRRSRSG